MAIVPSAADVVCGLQTAATLSVDNGDVRAVCIVGIRLVPWRSIGTTVTFFGHATILSLVSA